MLSKLSFRSLLAVGAFVLCWSLPAAAAGPITVEQISSTEILGSWTLAGPKDWTDQSDAATKTIDSVVEGNYTLLVRAPTGATVRLQLIKAGEVVQTADVGQMTFPLAGDESAKILVFYSFTLVGTVGAASDPTGLQFTVTGPNGYTETAVTPWSWTKAPQGQYSLKFKVPEGCTPPSVQGQKLQPGERIAFSITLDCAAADTMRDNVKKAGDQRIRQRAEESAASLSSSIFTDVSKDAWFAPYIWRVNQRNLMSGYKNADGTLTGSFGPDRSVSVAELVAIAERAGGLKAEANATSHNEYAQGEWFEGAYAAAEQAGWFITFDGGIDPARPATREEVVMTLLQAMNVPVQWPHGGVFSDVRPQTSNAASIETMAALGAIGTDKVDGRLPTFRPDDNVNRAEMSKMLILLLDNLEAAAAKAGK